MDDLLVCGPSDPKSVFSQKVKEFREAFPFGSWKHAREEPITFCGCELTQSPDFSIELNQEKYADSVSEINLTRERKEHKSEPLNEQEKKQFRILEH